MTNRIICIHPDDEDLSFLTPLILKLENDINKNCFEIYKLTNDVKIHYEAQQAISTATKNDLILFLCHGGTDYILGQGQIAEVENGGMYSKLIMSHNISILSNKKIVCVSCDSRVKLGKMAIEAGCLSFVGFGDIQFEDKYHLEHGEGVSNNVISLSQNAMCEILIDSILLTIKSKGSMQNFVDYFRLFTNKKCDNIISKNKGNEEFIRIANFLWNLKNEIILFGSKDLIFF